MRMYKTTNTRYDILQCATELFLERGYSATYVTTIANMLHISTGNLTFHFPTKEHLLAELVRELCAYQWEMEDRESEEAFDGEHARLATYLLELAMFTSVCAENVHVHDLLISAYTRTLPLEIIRKNDTERAKKTFATYCKDWTETEYIQAENVASGIEYAMFMKENTERLTLEQRIVSGLDAIMKVYDVPAGVRRETIAQVMATDYVSLGRDVFQSFCSYVEEKAKKSEEV